MHKIDRMKPKGVIKIVVLNQSINSSISRGDHFASDTTGDKLPYPSDYHSG